MSSKWALTTNAIMSLYITCVKQVGRKYVITVVSTVYCIVRCVDVTSNNIKTNRRLQLAFDVLRLN